MKEEQASDRPCVYFTNFRIDCNLQQFERYNKHSDLELLVGLNNFAEIFVERNEALFQFTGFNVSDEEDDSSADEGVDGKLQSETN